MKDTTLALPDLLILFFGILGFFVLNWRLRKQGTTDGKSYFLAGQKLPWYLLGLSMVATTFAADTPLWVTEKIAQHGVSGNWLWWNMLMGGMLTTFFFAKYWRRAGILTEPELIELRYSGLRAQYLRGFKAFYLGLFLNAVIIGWVNSAMIKILEVFFGLDYGQAFFYMALLMIFTAIYASLSGLLGIVYTDALQFIIAITGSIALAWIGLDLPEIGGMAGLKEKLPAWRFDFMPQLSSATGGVGTFALSIGAFFSYAALQWWNSWYPGAEPGGGGYISQRMMSARNEKEAVWSSLFFQIAHYCLRPWPWIIVGLIALVLYPELPVEDFGRAYVMVIGEHAPMGFKGIMALVFISAYMSTISTQLNWGSSYLVNDFYLRFVKKTPHRNDEYVRSGRIFTLLIMAVGLIASSFIKTIDTAAVFLINCGAGLGAVLILRWYWWRINALTEIVATVAPIPLLLFSMYILEPYFGEDYQVNNGSFYFTVLGSSVFWILATIFSKPTDIEVLKNFKQRIQPLGFWQLPGDAPMDKKSNKALLPLLLMWLSAIIMAYSVLFGVGHILFLNYSLGFLLLGLALLSGFLLFYLMKKHL